MSIDKKKEQERVRNSIPDEIHEQAEKMAKSILGVSEAEKGKELNDLENTTKVCN